MKIGFIGTGNMGGALIRGYLKNNPGNDIFIYDKNPDQIKKFTDIPSVSTTDSAEDLVAKSNIIVLAVKPDIFDSLLPEIQNTDYNKVYVSIAAGISIDYLKKMLGDQAKIIRTMPNLNSMVSQGMTGVSRDNLVGDDEMQNVMDLFNSVGKTVEVDEDQIDTVIGVSGSSPAYAFMFIDALIDGAVKNGMGYDEAKIFAAQATLGAAFTVMESGIDPKVLVKNVCSPGGTTIEAVEKLKELNFENIIEQAMDAAIAKSKIMTKK